MNIEVAGKLGRAMDYVSSKLDDADKALDAYIVALGALWASGGEAADILDKPSCLLSPRAQSHVASAVRFAALAQAEHTGMHVALHEDATRLAPNDDAQKSGGGGGKEPPPKP